MGQAANREGKGAIFSHVSLQRCRCDVPPFAVLNQVRVLPMSTDICSRGVKELAIDSR